MVLILFLRFLFWILFCRRVIKRNSITVCMSKSPFTSKILLLSIPIPTLRILITSMSLLTDSSMILLLRLLLVIYSTMLFLVLLLVLLLCRTSAADMHRLLLISPMIQKVVTVSKIIVNGQFEVKPLKLFLIDDAILNEQTIIDNDTVPSSD